MNYVALTIVIDVVNGVFVVFDHIVNIDVTEHQIALNLFGQRQFLQCDGRDIAQVLVHLDSGELLQRPGDTEAAVHLVDDHEVVNVEDPLELVEDEEGECLHPARVEHGAVRGEDAEAQQPLGHEGQLQHPPAPAAGEQLAGAGQLAAADQLRGRHQAGPQQPHEAADGGEEEDGQQILLRHRGAVLRQEAEGSARQGRGAEGVRVDVLGGGGEQRDQGGQGPRVGDQRGEEAQLGHRLLRETLAEQRGEGVLTSVRERITES